MLRLGRGLLLRPRPIIDEDGEPGGVEAGRCRVGVGVEIGILLETAVVAVE